MTEPQDDAFLRRSRALLDSAEAELDAATRARLRAARRAALARAAQGGASIRHQPWLLPAAGLAAAVLVAVLGVRLWAPGPARGDLSPLEDIVLLSDPADPEFYTDLEFYLWLDEVEPGSTENGRG